MIGQLARVRGIVERKMRALGLGVLPHKPVGKLLEIAYLASLRKEEGRFVKGSLTLADHTMPETDPPIIRRADYPCFTSFEKHIPLTPASAVKLSRAVDSWTGSIAVWPAPTGLVAWGILDQLVSRNAWMHREPQTGFPLPGVITVNIEGTGDISVYHRDLLIAALKKDRIITSETDALSSQIVREWTGGFLRSTAKQIATVLGQPDAIAATENALFSEWGQTLARIAIGLRRYETGGAVLLSPRPTTQLLDAGHRLPYTRLGDAMVLSVLDRAHSEMKWNDLHGHPIDDTPVPLLKVLDLQLAETDAEDRRDELTGAIKLATSLAAVDGLVLMTPNLHIASFGTKIRCDSKIKAVYDGADFQRRATNARQVDVSHLGTRHSSILRYCQNDTKALGLVVSQDGNVRLVASRNQNLLLWEDIKLLAYDQYTKRYATEIHDSKAARDSMRDTSHLGYTEMPKSIAELRRRGR